jgi:hypothetical protein
MRAGAGLSLESRFGQTNRIPYIHHIQVRSLFKFQEVTQLRKLVYTLIVNHDRPSVANRGCSVTPTICQHFKTKINNRKKHKYKPHLRKRNEDMAQSVKCRVLHLSPTEGTTMVQVAEQIHAIIQIGHRRFSAGPKVSNTRIQKTSLCHLRNFAN